MHSPDLFGDDSRPPEVPKPMPRRLVPSEYKVIALRDCPTPAELLQCDNPQRAVDYWRLHIATSPQFNPDCECLAVLLLNTRPGGIAISARPPPRQAIVSVEGQMK